MHIAIMQKTMVDSRDNGQTMAEIDARFGQIVARFDQVQDALVEQRRYTEFAYDRLVSKIDDLSAKMDQRFERMDQRFERMDQRFETIDQRFDRLERKLDRFIDLHT